MIRRQDEFFAESNGVCFWSYDARWMRTEEIMDKFIISNLVVLALCAIGIFAAAFLVSDFAQKLMVIFTIAIFYIAVQQSQAAHESAGAAKFSAQSAADSQRQATYLHLASLWYQIKQRGLECDDFIQPEFTTLYRRKEARPKDRQYDVYAWMSWGHAEDCYLKNYYTDEGFLPSIENYKEMHYAWLSVKQHRKKFSKEFMKWVDTELLQPKVEVRSRNSTEGQGVFASSAFEKGDFIGFFDGDFVRNQTKMSLQFGSDFHVQPATNSPFRCLNHSCNANAHFAGRNLYAWRDILLNEEITIDYNCHENVLESAFKCTCEVTGCVKKIEGYTYLTDEQKTQRERQTCSWLREESEAAD